jgi:hypothetical protein
MNKAIFLLALFFSGFQQATASVIYSGVIYNDSGFHSAFPSFHAIDQSGLSANYTSGVTDFDIYAATNPTHTGSSTTSGVTGTGALDLGVQAAFIDLDFGTTLQFTDFGLWNDEDGQGIKDFDIIISNVADFSSFTTLGTYTATVGPSDPIPLQLFDLAPTTGQYVRVNMLSTHGSVNINFGEYLFGANSTSVPEPSIIALFALGLFGIGFTRKRQA